MAIRAAGGTRKPLAHGAMRRRQLPVLMPSGLRVSRSCGRRCRLAVPTYSGTFLSNVRRLECRQYARGAEGDATQTNAGGVIDCVGDRRQQGFACGLATSVGREIGPVRI